MWLGGSSGIKAVIQIAVVAVLARLLNPSDFGLVAAAMVVILFTEMIYEMGVGPALIQMKDLQPRHEQTALTFSVCLGLVLVALFYYINPYIARFYGLADLTMVLNALVWIFPLRTFSQISYSLLQRSLKFKKLAGLDLVSYFIGYGIAGIALAVGGFGVWALVWATVIEAAIYCLLLVSIKPPVRRLSIDLLALRQLLSYGGSFTLAALLNFGARKIDYVIVGRMLGGDSLGLYSRAYALMNAPNNVAGTVMNKVLFASLSSIQNDENRMSTALDKSYELVFLTVLPLAGFCFVMAPEIISVLLGDKWLEATNPLRILLLSMVFRIGYKIGDVYLKSTGKTKYLAITQGIYFSLVTVGSVIGSKYGITGVAVGTTFAIITNFLIMTGWLIKEKVFSFHQVCLRTISSLPIFILVALTAYISSNIAYAMFSNSIVVMGITSALVVLCVSVSAYIAPSFFIGKNGGELYNFASQSARLKMKKFFD